MVEKNVVLVVDNPKRDLGGLSLLACRLAKLGIHAHLVPMYDQEVHIAAIKPDLILMNYCRPANGQRIKRYKNLGYRVGVLDTEGGILRDVYAELLISVEKSGAAELIDLYLLWGEKQYSAFIDFYKEHNFTNTDIALTGAPRYDFFDRHYESFFPQYPQLGNYVLLIASFPLCNPRFVSLDQEARNMAETLEYTYEQALEMQQLALKRMDAYLTLLGEIISRNKETQFVFRAHPFENHDTYKEFFANYSNVTFNEGGEIFSVLHQALAVVQINSSTGVEAALIGKPVLQPQFLQDSMDRVEQVESCSYLATTQKDMLTMLEAIIHKTPNDSMTQRKNEIEKYTNQLVSDFFHRIDGQSAYRAAEKIAQKTSDNSQAPQGIPAIKQFVFHYGRTLTRNLVKLSSRTSRSAKSLQIDTAQAVCDFESDTSLSVKKKSFYSCIPFCSSNRIVFSKRNHSKKP